MSHLRRKQLVNVRSPLARSAYSVLFSNHMLVGVFFVCLVRTCLSVFVMFGPDLVGKAQHVNIDFCWCGAPGRCARCDNGIFLSKLSTSNSDIHAGVLLECFLGKINHTRGSLHWQGPGKRSDQCQCPLLIPRVIYSSLQMPEHVPPTYVFRTHE